MDIWKHGKYVDMWSSVHLLSGFLLGALFYALEYTFLSALGLSLLVMAFWEFFEWITKIIEPSANVWTDVAFGLFGFLIAAYFYFYKDRTFDSEEFLLVFALTLFLSLWGFYDFLKRGYR